MAYQRVLLVGHGSPDPEAVAECRQFAAALARHLDEPVRMCFMELAEPGLQIGLRDAAVDAGQGGEVDVLPLFLAAARHQKGDVSAAVRQAAAQYPGINWRYGSPLGYHAYLVDLAHLRAQEALQGRPGALPPAESHVVLVGRGSNDPAANAEIAAYAHYLRETGGYLDVQYAFQAAAQPDVAEGVRRCSKLGARQIILSPFILFTGHVFRTMCRVAQQAADAAGIPLVRASYLAPHPLLLEIATQRLQEARQGRSSMSCDMCRFRWPAAGDGQEAAAGHEHDHACPACGG